MKWLIELILGLLKGSKSTPKEDFSLQKESETSKSITNEIPKSTSEVEKSLKSNEPKKTAKKTGSKKMAVFEVEPWENVNWAMPDAKISKYFTVREALWLNSWNKMALPDAEQRKNIYRMALKMDEIREFIGVPLYITSWLRPSEYNAHIGGSKRSYHMKGLAVDFVSKRMSAEDMRQKLLPKLKALGIRMEDNKHIGKGNWVHVDLGKVRLKRFFKP